jgi:hypothetical protein
VACYSYFQRSDTGSGEEKSALKQQTGTRF